MAPTTTKCRDKSCLCAALATRDVDAMNDGLPPALHCDATARLCLKHHSAQRKRLTAALYERIDVMMRRIGDVETRINHMAPLQAQSA